MIADDHLNPSGDESAYYAAEDEIPEGWCDADHLDHEWQYGDPECRRCGADLSEWNTEYEEEMNS